MDHEEKIHASRPMDDTPESIYRRSNVYIVPDAVTRFGERRVSYLADCPLCKKILDVRDMLFIPFTSPRMRIVQLAVCPSCFSEQNMGEKG